MRWTGQRTVPQAVEHAFFASADDGIRIFVDDKAVFDDWNAHTVTDSTGQVTLTAGRALRIEYFQIDGPAQFAIAWQPPGGVRGVLPTEALAPTATQPKLAGPGWPVLGNGTPVVGEEAWP